MATTLIRVYNDALRRLNERRLREIGEDRDARHHLDDAMAEVQAHCLEQGFWNFAMRSVRQDASVSVVPTFGFTYAFEKPSDWVRTYIVSPDDRMEMWTMPFNDENGIWWANITPIFARYVSSSPSFGYDLGAWPQSFADYVAARLAWQAGPSIKSPSADLMDRLEKEERKALFTAKNKDAMNEPPGMPPNGTWVRARGGVPAINSTSRGLI